MKPLSQTSFAKSYKNLVGNNYYIIVIVDVTKNLIAASGTIFVEQKFIHSRGHVGHIEGTFVLKRDIVVSISYRKLNFGRIIIEQLKSIGKDVGCYKKILDCSDKNVPFYEKCGFVKKEVEMVMYIDKESKL